MNIADLTIERDIHDSWTELLSGTRFLLDILENQNGNINKVNLLRLIIVSSSQMTEVMFFTQLIKCIKSKSEPVQKLFNYDLNQKIFFSAAKDKWPEILTGNKFDLGSEPMQSMDRLSTLRNKAIHYTAACPQADIAESAFFTAIESSKYIYNHFNNNGWESSSYKIFVNNNKTKTTTLLCNVLNH